MEYDLLRKLVMKQHLNVPDRRALPGGKARFSVLTTAAAEVVVERGWLPVDWRPNGNFSGGLIERLADGSCRTYWKGEVACQRYELQAVRDFATPEEAAAHWLKTMFPDGIDGIPIDWSA